jgi:pyridoxamine 5'-phosphate oxidase
MNRDNSPALSAMRRHYTLARLTRRTIDPDPIVQFESWLAEAIAAEVIEPNAMTLATCSRDGHPLVRTVLLKGLDSRGFVFFTNLESRKARHIAENPSVSLVFPWLALERQVIITGTAAKVADEETLRYFVSRPRESQIAAWASRQSHPIESRTALEAEWAAVEARFSDGGEIPVPPFWGGFRVVPQTIEFWQGGPHRLHDRLQYTRGADGQWMIERLAP